jgi:hypothetical protein
MADPTRTKLRNDKELPMCMKSTIDILRDPEIPEAHPKTEMDDPTRMKLRIDKELPM